MLEFTHNGISYELAEGVGYILMSIDGQPYRYYKVKKDTDDYVFRIQKTQIKAHNGAAGLLHHFQKCLEEDFAVDAWVISPIWKIWETVRPWKGEYHV